MNDRKQINTAGGSPAASHFFLLRQRKSNQKEGDPGLPPLRGTLDQRQASGAAQLDLEGRTPRAPLRDSNSARLNLRLLAVDRGGAQGMKRKILKSGGTMCHPTGLNTYRQMQLSGRLSHGLMSGTVPVVDVHWYP